MLGSSWVSAQLTASQEGLIFMKLVCVILSASLLSAVLLLSASLTLLNWIAISSGVFTQLDVEVK
jgi:hypothetical protein